MIMGSSGMPTHMAPALAALAASSGSDQAGHETNYYLM